MGILDEVSSATGDKQSNTEVVKRCIETPALLHTVAEGLRTGLPDARLDCAQILVEVAKRRPDLLSGFVNDFIDASREALKNGGSRKVGKFGFAGLALVTSAQPADVFAERDYLLETARGKSSYALDAVAVLAELCRNNPNYRGKLIGSVLRLLPAAPEKDFPKWLATIGPAVEGSGDAYKRLAHTIADRRQALPEATRAKVDRTMVKLERSSVKKRK